MDKKNIALELREVSFHYENMNEKVINQLSMSVKAGEFISIIGASGSGKSTICNLIASLEKETTGEILLHGEKLTNRRGKVGYMPQEDSLLPWRTIRENVLLPLEIKQKEMESDIDKMLADFGLAGYENKYPHELSGGMRQRVAFLRTTLLGEDILLLDEPFSSLDAITKLHMQEWLLSKWEKNKSTIVFITHDISEAIFLSDRIFVIGEQPITSLEAIEVPLPRPRKWTDVDKPSVIDLKHNLIRRFRTKVNL